MDETIVNKILQRLPARTLRRVFFLSKEWTKKIIEFYPAVVLLERAELTFNEEERDRLAKEAFDCLLKFPHFVNLEVKKFCERFEKLRFYEAVVRLPLQKAKIWYRSGEFGLVYIEECYMIIANALRAVNGDASLREDVRYRYIHQIVSLGAQSPDKAFHEYLYRILIDLDLKFPLIISGGPDVENFLHDVIHESLHEAVTVQNFLGQSMIPMRRSQIKYVGILSLYYIVKKKHVLAAKLLERLAEVRCSDDVTTPSLEDRYADIDMAVVQITIAKSESSDQPRQTEGVNNVQGSFDNKWVELLERKKVVIKFQVTIKGELEAMASRLDASSSTSACAPDGLQQENRTATDANLVHALHKKAEELSLDLKNITQLLDDYAAPYNLWEICLEMRYFASYSSNRDRTVLQETWAVLIDHALSIGGICEACAALKRVGSRVYFVDGAALPLDFLCLQLEKAALDRVVSGVETVGDEIIPRTLLATACKGAAKPMLRAYDKLLSDKATSPILRLRFLGSVLAVLREYAISSLAFPMYDGALARDYITHASNRYLTEVLRLPLLQSQTEEVVQGFRELEESLFCEIYF